ncbi:unnamed protein product [Lupinus luteus]|uniref:Expansin n=1 Tax=Lupinus luteus TaxID=3873 RepID=A0AAV1WGB2_LUPLU
MFTTIAIYKAGIIPVKYHRIPCTKIGGVKFELTRNPYWLQVLKSFKAHHPLNKPKPSSPPSKTSSAQKNSVPVSERKTVPTPSRLGVSDSQHCNDLERDPASTSVVATERTPGPKIETLPKKLAVEFGEPGS